jgi:hypothetical protein
MLWLPHPILVDAAGPITSILHERERNSVLVDATHLCMDPPPDAVEWPEHFKCPKPGAPWDFTFDFSPPTRAGAWKSRIIVVDWLGRTAPAFGTRGPVSPC